jgi:signal transduction histidine kinase
MYGHNERQEAKRPGMILRYTVAVACVAAGVLVAAWTEPVLHATTLLLAAVVIAAWFGGMGPGLMASALATLAVDYYFTPPFHTFEPGIEQVPRILVFGLLGVLSAWGSTARKHAERALREARDQLEERVRERTAELEDLAGRLIHAQEEERSRIGRELHDHISQLLGILTIRIDQLRSTTGMPATTIEGLDALRQSASEITDDVHRLSHRLHSSTLDYLGLAPGIQKLVAEFAARYDIRIAFTHDGIPASLPSEVSLCLFRIAEESLTNIAKHSRAKSATLRAAGTGDEIALTIEDAGAGFDKTMVERRAGLGLVSMQERLRALRGTIAIDSAPGRGTRIVARVPVVRAVDAPPIAVAPQEPV